MEGKSVPINSTHRSADFRCNSQQLYLGNQTRYFKRRDSGQIGVLLEFSILIVEKCRRFQSGRGFAFLFVMQLLMRIIVSEDNAVISTTGLIRGGTSTIDDRSFLKDANAGIDVALTARLSILRRLCRQCCCLIFICARRTLPPPPSSWLWWLRVDCTDWSRFLIAGSFTISRYLLLEEVGLEGCIHRWRLFVFTGELTCRRY